MINIEKDDIICCGTWRTLTDFEYGVTETYKILRGSGAVSVHVDTGSIHEFFADAAFADPGRKFVVVSGGCDFGVAEQSEHPAYADIIKHLQYTDFSKLGYNGFTIPSRANADLCNINHKYSIKCYAWTHATFPNIPDNIVKWFVSNPMINDDRVDSIPFGISNESREPLYEFMQKGNLDRDKTLYINFSNHTYERALIKNKYRNSYATTIEKFIDYQDYLLDLATHKFVLCPNGNGLDCYRNLESLYLGAIPIIEDGLYAGAYHKLPILRIRSEDLLDMHESQLISLYPQICEYMNECDYSKLKTSYWKTLINNAKNI